MEDFFAARVEMYDDHMLHDVAGCKEGYEEMAAQLPDNTRRLLDLGCGTGLELGPIFRRFPELAVTGVDLAQPMLDKAAQKYPGKALTLLCGDYFSVPLSEAAFDAAVSFQTMHHFAPAAKTALYQKIWCALDAGGCYIECDYMAPDQQYEDFYFAENARLRREQNIPEGAFFHYDTPCTTDNQIAMLRAAGFCDARVMWRLDATVMIKAVK